MIDSLCQKIAVYVCLVILKPRHNGSRWLCFSYFVMQCNLCVGVSLEGGNKKYLQTTERPVHISMAALDPFQGHGKLFNIHSGFYGSLHCRLTT